MRLIRRGRAARRKRAGRIRFTPVTSFFHSCSHRVTSFVVRVTRGIGRINANVFPS